MKNRMGRSFELALLAVAVLLSLVGTGWGGPPAPPAVAAAPTVPVGGAGVTFATALAVAAYGIWKSRR